MQNSRECKVAWERPKSLWISLFAVQETPSLPIKGSVQKLGRLAWIWSHMLMCVDIPSSCLVAIQPETEMSLLGSALKHPAAAVGGGRKTRCCVNKWVRV